MVVCFIGHRNIAVEESFKEHLVSLIKELITDKHFDIFLFGSRSQFDDLCLETVSQLKNDYPHIKRIYVRAAYPYIDDDYKKYLLNFYDETYMPDNVAKAGKAAYIERNRHMIDRSDLCVFYYDEHYNLPIKQTLHNQYLPIRSSHFNSGTKLAYQYAVSKNKTILNLFSIPQN